MRRFLPILLVGIGILLIVGSISWHYFNSLVNHPAIVPLPDRVAGLQMTDYTTGAQAAAFALTNPDVQKVTAKMRAAYARRRAHVMKLSAELESEKVIVTPPQGAFYCFLDLRALKMNDVEMCERILEEKSVGLVPGSAFGEQGEGFIRMSFAASDEKVKMGSRKIVEWAEEQ